MKNFKFLILLFVAVSIFTSCKKDDPSDNKNASAIVGKWKKSKEVETTYRNGVKGDVYTETSFGAEDYVEYKSNGQYVISAGFMTLNYKVEGSKIIYTVAGMSIGEETIISNTSSVLVLEEEEVDDNGDGEHSVVQRTYTKM